MNTGDELLLTAICPLQVAQHRSDQVQKQLARRGTDRSDQLQKQLARRGTDRSDQLQKQLARRGTDLLPMCDQLITAEQDLAALQGTNHTSMKARSCFPLHSPGFLLPPLKRPCCCCTPVSLWPYYYHFGKPSHANFSQSKCTIMTVHLAMLLLIVCHCVAQVLV